MTTSPWKDKKHTFFLSKADNLATINTVVPRKSRNGDVRQMHVPSIAPRYNDDMNGVDHADELRTEYIAYRSSRRWWLYLFWFLFDGFIMMKESANH